MLCDGIAMTGGGISVEGQVPHLPMETPSPAVMAQKEFLDLVEPMRAGIVRHVETKCSVKADAEDAVQDAIVYCLEHRDQYNPEEASLKTWVTRKALWCAIDINDDYKRRSRFKDNYPDFDDTDDEGDRQSYDKY